MNLGYRKCVICQQRFKPKTHNQLTCCKECGRLYKNQYFRDVYKKSKKAGSMAKIKKVCLYCGCEFETIYHNKKFCCKHCSITYFNRKRQKIPKTGNKLSQLGKNNVVRWIRLKLTDGTVATNKEPYSPELCAALYRVPVEEIYAALDEYDRLVAEGRDEEFYKGV